jgi:hypothetical protein
MNLKINKESTVPPVVYAGRSDIPKVSYTTPWPENAASPCNKTGIAVERLASSPAKN